MDTRERITKAVRKGAMYVSPTRLELKTEKKGVVLVSCEAPPTESVEAVAEEILESAKSYVEADGNTCKFLLETQVNGEVSSRLMFQLKGETGVENDSEESHIPAILNSVRMYNQTAFHLIANLFDTLRKENESMRSRSERLESTFGERLQLLEELRTQKHERELDLLSQARSEERKDRLFSEVETRLLPAVLDRVTGNDKVGRFVKAIRPDQFEKLSEILDEEQQTALLAVLGDMKQ